MYDKSIKCHMVYDLVLYPCKRR